MDSLLIDSLVNLGANVASTTKSGDVLDTIGALLPIVVIGSSIAYNFVPKSHKKTVKTISFAINLLSLNFKNLRKIWS